MVGRVSIRPISSGDAITEQKLKPKAGGAGSGFMTYIIPQGHRAITVAVNEVAGVAGFITPNDRVDVVLTTTIPGSKDENITKIILQNVPVLATGQITEQKEGKPVIVPTVTLDLTPDDSEKIVLAASKGKLQLLLRNIADSAPVDAKGATISKVLTGTTQSAVVAATPSSVKVIVTRRTVRKKAPTRAAPTRAQAPAAAPAPRSSHSVTIIDGGVRTTKEFVLQ
jgi:pilus assembly protein CpaB